MEADEWREKLLRSYKKLVETDLYLAVDECFSEGIFTCEEKDTLETINSPSDKNRHFLKILLLKTGDVFTKFLECLTADHSDIKTTITEADVSKPLKLETDENAIRFRRQIYRNYKDIIQKIALKGMVDDFISERLFEIEDWEKITNTNLTTTEQNRKFLNILFGKETSACHLFMSLLTEMGRSDLIQQIEITEVKQEIDKEIECHLRKDGLKNLQIGLVSEEISRGKLKFWYEEDETFCSTTATAYIYEEVVGSGNVIVSGPPGSGKSANVHHIALKLKNQGHKICYVQRFEEMVDKIETFVDEEEQVYVFDDVFGVHGVVEEKRLGWSDENKEEIDCCLRNPKIKILCTSRLQVLKDDKLSSIISNFSIVDISEGEIQLSSEERVAIFRKHALHKNREELLTEDVTHKIKHTECPIGCFPLVCRLYTADKETKQPIEEYFDKPLNVIAGHIKKLCTEEPLRYFCLLLCMVYANCIPLKQIEVSDENNEARKLREELLELCKCPVSTSREEIRDKMNTLLKTFLKLEDGTYHFIHDIIQDAVIKHVSGLSSSVHKVVLRHSNTKFMHRRIRLSDIRCQDSDSCINLRPDAYQAWAERVIRDIRDGLFMADCLYHDISVRRSSIASKRFDDNYWIDVFNNPCLCTEGDKILALSISKIPDCDTETLMSTQGYTIPWNKYTICIKTRHTALHWAVKFGLSHTVKQTLEALSNATVQKVNAIDNLLSVACKKEKNDEVIKELIANGIDINQQSKSGRTMLWNCVWKKKYQTAKLLIEHGACINISEDRGRSPLHMSVYNGDFQTTELLVQHGASVDLQDLDYCWSPLHVSVYQKDYETTNLLLKNDAKVDLCDEDGRSALYLSVDNKDYSLTELLVENNANVNLCDTDGRSPLYLSQYLGIESISNLLKCHGARCMYKGREYKDASEIPSSDSSEVPHTSAFVTVKDMPNIPHGEVSEDSQDSECDSIPDSSPNLPTKHKKTSKCIIQ